MIITFIDFVLVLDQLQINIIISILYSKKMKRNGFVWLFEKFEELY